MRITDEFKALRKGDRVRKYTDASHVNYTDGTVIKGLNGIYDGHVYVQWDGERITDMSVNICDLYKIID